MSGRNGADRILVGRFGAPHGVRGEVRLQSFTQDPSAIANYGALTVKDGTTRYTIKTLRLIKDNLFVARIEGITDRTAAEALTNRDLFIGRDVLPPPDEDEFYLADLIGLEAVDAAGEKLGSIVGMPNYGGGDLIEVRPAAGGESLLYPFTKAVVPTVDILGGRVTIVPPDEVEEDTGGETD